MRCRWADVDADPVARRCDCHDPRRPEHRPGDPTERAKRLAVARTLAGQLPSPHRASALGIVERTARTWEQRDMDQRGAWESEDVLP